MEEKLQLRRESKTPEGCTPGNLRGNLILGVLNWTKKCHALPATLETERDRSWYQGAEFHGTRQSECYKG